MEADDHWLHGAEVILKNKALLGTRLTRVCPMNPQQRGFMASANGCADNLMILDGIMRNSREQNAPWVVVFVDFARAFDSISHEHVLYALEER